MTQRENTVMVRAQVSHDPVMRPQRASPHCPRPVALRTLPLIPARNSLFGSALRDQKPHDFNTSPSKTEGTAGELRAKFWGAGVSVAGTKTRQEPGTTTETGRGRGGPDSMQRGRGRARTRDRAGQKQATRPGHPSGTRPGQTCARSVTSASVSSTRSRGLSSTLRPRRPPETIMVSWSRHAESMNNRWGVVCPSGLMPPTT